MNVRRSQTRIDMLGKFLEEWVIKLAHDERPRDFRRFTFPPEPSIGRPLHSEARQIAYVRNSAKAAIFPATRIRRNMLMIRQPGDGRR